MSSRIKSRLYTLLGVFLVLTMLVTAACMTSQPPLPNALAAADTDGKARPNRSFNPEPAATASATPTAASDADAKPKPADGQEKPAAGKQGSANLPLKRVVLFSSGVGYFEHDGKVTDNAKVDLKFKVKDINDLLKSMVVQDFDGGQISTVGYGSNDPLDKRLSSFAINLNGNPPLAQLLEQIRGEKVEIDAPNKIIGTSSASKPARRKSARTTSSIKR